MRLKLFCSPKKRLTVAYYVIILGFKDSGVDLGKSEAPLAFLAPQTGLGFLGTLINLGALLSFFSCTLACINSTARIIFAMARHGLFHDALSEAHQTNKTPHIAVALSALITFSFPHPSTFPGSTDTNIGGPGIAGGG